jgi:putative ABC transport system permease protein
MKSTFWKNNILEAAPEFTIGVRARGESFPVAGTWFDREIPVENGTWRTGLARLRPRWRIEGTWPSEGSNEIALGAVLSRDTGLRPGDAFEADAGDTSARFVVSGVVHAGGLDDRAAWAPLERVQSLGHRPDAIDRVWFSALVRPQPPGPEPDPAADPAAFERYMCAAYPSNVAREISDRVAGAEARPLAEIVAGEAIVVGRLNLLMLLLALAVLAVSVLGLVSTTTASVVERSSEIGLLRSMGAAPAAIATLLLGESGLFALLGGALGWVTGSAAAALIRGDVFGAGATFQPMLLPVALALAMTVSVLGTLGPLRLALRLDPAEALRG